MNADQASPLIALPLPLIPTRPAAVNPTCDDGVWYVSARSGAGAWAILKCDATTAARGTVGGSPGPPRWTYLSASPTSGTKRPLFWVTVPTPELRYPYHGLGDAESTPGFTGSRLRYFTHDAAGGGGLYYSDDQCATWTSAGISPVYVARDHYYGLMYAAGASALYRSRDFGATWAAIPSSAPPAGSWRFVASPGAASIAFDAGGSTTDFFGAGAGANQGKLRTGNTVKHRYISAVADSGVWYAINEFVHFAFPPDYADPVFAGSDPNDRSWTDAGSDDGAFTCDSMIGGICVHRTFPWVTSKVYRGRYGPYGAAPAAGEVAFYPGGEYSGLGIAVLRASQAQSGPLVVPIKSALPAASDPYDETALKDGGFDSDLPGTDAAHFNAAGYAHNPMLVCQESPGGLAWIYHLSQLAYAGWENHPYSLTTNALDAAGHNNAGEVCYLVGLDDATQAAGRCSFAVAHYQPTVSPVVSLGGHSYKRNDNRYEDASISMLADTGAYWVASSEGIAAYQPEADGGA